MINFICEMSANLEGREHLLDLVRLCYSQNDEVVVVNASVFSLSVPAQLIWAEYTCIFVPGLQQCYRMGRAHLFRAHLHRKIPLLSCPAGTP